MISCILLAAGLSKRFGSAKALAPVDGAPLIECLQKRLLSTQLSEIIVVLGAHRDQIQPHLLNHKQVKVVYNKDYKYGQTSSFKEGLKAVNPRATAVMLLPVDYPRIRPETIDQLISSYIDTNPLILVPVFKKAKGHPPLFALRLKDEILALNNDMGLNEIARRHAQATVWLPVEDAGIVQTFNTPEEYQAIMAVSS